MKKTPLQVVKERFGSKEALAKELAPMLTRREGESVAELTERLSTVSNKKLLHLFDVETRMRERFGSREKLVDEICRLTFVGRKVDQDYRNKLLTFSTAKLMDRHAALAKKSR